MATAPHFDPTPANPNPARATRVFDWLICESFDDKGNTIFYEYKAEESAGNNLPSSVSEPKRTAIRRARPGSKSAHIACAGRH